MNIPDKIDELYGKGTGGERVIFAGKLIMSADPSLGCVATCHENSGGDEPETLHANAELIVALHNSWPLIKEVLEAAEKALP